MNGYRNECCVFKASGNQITEDFVIKLPEGFAVTCSHPLKDEETLLLGNSIGTIYFCAVNFCKLLKFSFEYHSVIELIRPLSKGVKGVETNPIFAPLYSKDMDQDVAVVSVDSHPYISSRIAIAYENNLVIVYDFGKQKLESTVDVGSAVGKFPYLSADTLSEPKSLI